MLTFQGKLATQRAKLAHMVGHLPLIPSGALHLFANLMRKEVNEQEAYIVKSEEPALSPSEIEEYKRLASDLERLYDSGAEVFEVRPWPIIYG